MLSFIVALQQGSERREDEEAKKRRAGSDEGKDARDWTENNTETEASQTVRITKGAPNPAPSQQKRAKR